MEEVWKDIEGFENKYLISNLGRVKSMPNKTRKTKIILGNRYDDIGRKIVNLWLKKRSKNYKVHQLVWDAFGDRLRDGHRLQIDHIDEDKTNNRIDNLQLLNNKENTRKHYRYSRIFKIVKPRVGLAITLDTQCVLEQG